MSQQQIPFEFRRWRPELEKKAVGRSEDPSERPDQNQLSILSPPEDPNPFSILPPSLRRRIEAWRKRPRPGKDLDGNPRFWYGPHEWRAPVFCYVCFGRCLIYVFTMEQARRCVEDCWLREEKVVPAGDRNSGGGYNIKPEPLGAVAYPFEPKAAYEDLTQGERAVAEVKDFAEAHGWTVTPYNDKDNQIAGKDLRFEADGEKIDVQVKSRGAKYAECDGLFIQTEENNLGKSH